jgi:hypothetical protein
MINWDKLTNGDLVTIRDIVKRAQRQLGEIIKGDVILDLQMDLSALAIRNSKTSEVFLNKLLMSNDFNFIHDIVGIRRHMNRDNGELTKAFLPRCMR